MQQLGGDRSLGDTLAAPMENRSINTMAESHKDLHLIDFNSESWLTMVKNGDHMMINVD